MAERAISIRLDEAAQQALVILTTGGVSRSAAIRSALVEAAERRERGSIEAEAALLAADPDDLAEMADVATFMESLRAAG